MRLDRGLALLVMTLVLGCDDSPRSPFSEEGKAAAASAAAPAPAPEPEGAAASTVSSPTPPAKGPEVICDLDGVHRTRRPDGTLVSFELSVSHSGAHVAVTRAVRYSVNNNMRRVEIDGQPGPTFRSIVAARWSADGSTYVFAGQNFQDQIPGVHVVHKGARHGPYDRLRGLAVSADGTSWAALVQGKAAATQPSSPVTLIVDGEERVLAGESQPVTETFQFDASANAFVYQTENTSGPWITIDGKPVAQPNPPPRTALPFPPGVNVKSNKVGKGKDARYQLIVNGATVGEYDYIFARPDSFMPAYPQADGSLFAYVVDGDKLVRLRL